MTSTAPEAVAVAKAIDSVMRSDLERLLSVLVASLRDLTLAEDALQETSLSALTHWGKSGLPHSPQGWLLTVARRKALERLRATGRARRMAGALALIITREETDRETISDERLRLIFACCHPRARPEVTRRPDPADGLLTDHARNRTRVSRRRDNDGPASEPRQGQDRRRRSSV